MRAAIIVVILLSMLIVGFLVVMDLKSRTDDRGNIEAIEKSRQVREKTEEVNREMEKFLKKKVSE